MIVCETDRAMSELSRKLNDELKTLSYRDLEAKTGVSRGSLEGIARDQLTEFPKLETLDKLAVYWKLPLWRVVEMAGAALGGDERYSRLARELQVSPWIVERFDDLISITREEFDEVMDYLAFRRRQRGLLPPDEDPPTASGR